MVTRPRRLSDTASVASFGSPLPNAGDGGGGDRHLQSAPNLRVGLGLLNYRDSIQTLPAPSPLAPLPHWGEGNRNGSFFLSGDRYRHHILQGLNGFLTLVFFCLPWLAFG